MTLGSDAPVSIVVITMFRRTLSLPPTHTIHYIYADIYRTTCSTDVIILMGIWTTSMLASLRFTRLGRQ